MKFSNNSIRFSSCYKVLKDTKMRSDPFLFILNVIVLMPVLILYVNLIFCCQICFFRPFLKKNVFEAARQN